MSKDASSVCATRLVKAASRLTPRLILPDWTMIAFLAASLTLAWSPAFMPVVPMTCTLPSAAACAANTRVADGAVKSTMPSACSRNGRASPASFTPFSGVPASSPESQPISGERASSSAPASSKSLLSAIALTSVRPIRPPAPATTSRMAVIGQLRFERGYSAARRKRRLRLRAVIALDDENVGGRMRQPPLDVLLIFRRAVAGERGGIVGKFDDHVARTRGAFGRLELSGTDDELSAEFLEDRGVGRGVGLVAFFVFHIDTADPVTLGHFHSCLPCGLCNLIYDCGGRCPRIGGFHNRSANHQIVGAGGNRLGRRHHALLVVLAAARGPDARRHQHHARPDELAQIGRLLRRAHQPVDLEVARLASALRHQRGHAELGPRREQVGVVVRREYGHGKNLELTALGGERRRHGLRIGMHGQEAGADLRHAFNAPGDGVGDVVQLEIEKHFLAGGNKPGGKWQAAGESELIADLVERNRVTQPRHHILGGLYRGQIERDDQTVTGSRHNIRHIINRATSTSRANCARSRLAVPVSVRLSMASNAVSALATVTCSGITKAPQPSSRICRRAISERAPPSAPGEAALTAKTRPLKAA